SILKQTVGILMQSAAPLDYALIKETIESMDKVKNIHHVHSWMSNEKTIHFEAHIDLDDMLVSEAEQIFAAIEEYLIHDQGITHVTLQAETNRCDDKNLFKF
ncbi:MAG: cation transporter dimerization domain-containing protein, partial [Bacilli bacterium]